MQIHQEVIQFVKAALECSIYICPLNPGLTYEELLQVAKNTDYLEGEINDAIPQMAPLYWGQGDANILPNKDDLTELSTFSFSEDPEYRNPVAFNRVFDEMRHLVRQKGIANAQIERSALVAKCVARNQREQDIQVAITVLVFNEILSDKDGFIRFGRGKESWGSPGDQTTRPQLPGGRKLPRPARGRAYPIVKAIIEAREQPSSPVIANDTVQGATVQPPPLTNDEWISASKALNLLGRKSGNAIAICKRARAGLIKTRAKRFIKDNEIVDDIEIPKQFWWAGGHEALSQNWQTGDFETWIDHKVHLQAFGVEFRRSDIESMGTISEKEPSVADNKVFIGHGRSLVWLQLKDFLRDQLHLSVDEFNSVSTAGMAIPARLSQMLDGATFAFLIMTAEDETVDGKQQARLNVIHEVGLFQGRLGFNRAIILLEDGCEQFSNIHGLGYISFPKNNIGAAFEPIRQVLARERVIPPN